MSKKEELKRQILQLTREYYNEVHKTSKVFEPGKSFVNYGGRYFNDEEMVNLVDSSLDFWLTAGPWAHKFETRLAKWLGGKTLCAYQLRFQCQPIGILYTDFPQIRRQENKER